MIKLVSLGKGQFKVSPRPRGGEWLEVEIGRYRQAGVTLIASLLTPAEEFELELTDEGKVCQQQGIEFRRFPIRDRQVPADRQAFLEFAASLSNHLKEGGKALLHCRAGIGRAALLGCALLTLEGLDAETAWALIEEARGQEVPDTVEQRAWVAGRTSAGRPMSLESALFAAGEEALEFADPGDPYGSS